MSLGSPNVATSARFTGLGLGLTVGLRSKLVLGVGSCRVKTLIISEAPRTQSCDLVIRFLDQGRKLNPRPSKGPSTQ